MKSRHALEDPVARPPRRLGLWSGGGLCDPRSDGTADLGVPAAVVVEGQVQVVP